MKEFSALEDNSKTIIFYEQDICAENVSPELNYDVVYVVIPEIKVIETIHAKITISLLLSKNKVPRFFQKLEALVTYKKRSIQLMNDEALELFDLITKLAAVRVRDNIQNEYDMQVFFRDPSKEDLLRFYG
jgi:hypothetical protein